MSDEELFAGWKAEEKRHKMRVAAWVAGAVAAVAAAFGLWFALFRHEKLPMACEAAIQKVEGVCHVNRRKAVGLIKHSKALVPNDANRRETCRVLASTDHQFWRRQAIRALAKAAAAGREENLPDRIPAQGMLTQEASQFVDRSIIKPFIRRMYCGRKAGSTR